MQRMKRPRSYLKLIVVIDIIEQRQLAIFIDGIHYHSFFYIYIISFILSILPKLILGKRAELVMTIIIRKLVIISVGLTTIATHS